MSPGKLAAIWWLGFYCILSSSAMAKDRLAYYAAGALTMSENTCVRQIDHNSNRSYRIKLGFINYSDSSITLNYRGGNSDLKTVTLEAHGQCGDLITMNTLQGGTFNFEIRASFLESKFNFVTYDILLIEDD